MSVTFVIGFVTKFTVLFWVLFYFYHSFSPIMKKRRQYSGNLEIVPGKQIFLNIHNLAKGIYILKVTHNNKVIKEVTFKK